MSKSNRPRGSEIIGLLVGRYPKCFFTYEAKRKPLKVGILNDLLARLDSVITRHELVAGLHFYCNNLTYLRKCTLHAGRIDLDGVVTSTVDEKEATYAQRKLAELRMRKAKIDADKVAEGKPQTETEVTPKPAPLSKSKLTASRVDITPKRGARSSVVVVKKPRRSGMKGP
jgi:sRNA-binding protein